MEDLPDAQHNPTLTGHDAAIDLFMQAAAGRLHHGWLIHGPEGVGKASFAFHVANHLLSGGKQKIGALDVAERNYRLIAAGSHPDLIVVGRPVDEKTGVMKEEIPVDPVRELSAFFQRTSGQDGWRVAIIKRADTLNRNAANALLKILEEPPPRGLILMTAVAPGRLLPTLRSRCRPLRLHALPGAALDDILGMTPGEYRQDDIALLHRLADGSPGRALDILQQDGLQLYRDFLSLLQTPAQERTAAILRFAGGKIDSAKFGLIARFAEDWLRRVARLAATGEVREMSPGEGQLLRRMAAVRPLAAWFDTADHCARQFALAQTASLDKRLVLVNNLQQILV